MMRLRQEVAKKHELGPHNNRKKPRKEDDMEGRSSLPSKPFRQPNPLTSSRRGRGSPGERHPHISAKCANSIREHSAHEVDLEGAAMPTGWFDSFLCLDLCLTSLFSPSSQREISSPSRRSPKAMSSLPSRGVVGMIFRVFGRSREALYELLELWREDDILSVPRMESQ